MGKIKSVKTLKYQVFYVQILNSPCIEHVASFPGINGLSVPIQTRRHSSRMRTTRLLTVRVLMAATGRQCRGWGVMSQVNKFEQVSSDDHQISVEVGGGIPGPMLQVVINYYS